MTQNIDPGLARLNLGISRALKQFRREAKLSQADLAQMVGANQSLISRLEQQDCDSYSISTLFRVFSKMNLDIEIAFVEREDVPTNKSLSQS